MDVHAITDRVYGDAVAVIARNRPILAALRSGYRLGVVSNFTGNLVPCLEEVAMADLFDVVTDSGVLGITKPELLPFTTTLEQLGVSPDRAWMVGDNFQADVRPAQRLGMRTVWLAPADRELPAGDPPTARIGSLAQLPAVLETALATAQTGMPAMHGLILAGGTGSRLAADGVDGPKAAVAIAGRPQLVRLVGTLHDLGCPSITCMLRDNAGDATTRTAHAMRALLNGVAELGSTAVRVVPCRTPSSLHTLVNGLATVPPGDVFCTMVDTVMRNRDWHLVYATATDLLAAGADAVLAVTPFVDDERPLWVERNAAGVVRRLGDAACITAVRDRRCVRLWGCRTGRGGSRAA